MNKKLQLQNAVLDVVKAMSELHLMVEKDSFMLDLFNKGVQTTGALSCSLDELIAEWQTVANNVQIDAQALYESWVSSAKLYKDLGEKEQSALEDMGLRDHDIVFEDSSFIQVTHRLSLYGGYEVRFHVLLGNIEPMFNTYEDAVRYLWDSHAKLGYGL